MDKYKKLFSNSIIFAIGSFGSSVLSFVMIPFYTYLLTNAQYGMVDYIQTTVFLLTPVVGLSLFESTLRFVMDDEMPKKVVVSTTFFASLILSLGFIVIFMGIRQWFHIDYFWYFIAILILTIFNTLIQNYARGAGFVKTFAVSGVVTTVLLVLGNITFLVFLHQGIKGYLISILLSILGSIVVNLLWTDFMHLVSVHYFKVDDLWKLLRYSIPLIPNSISWWLTSDVNRILLVTIIGVAANGTFAVASKPGALLTMVFLIFLRSWQLSATEEIESEDRHAFFSNIFSMVSAFHFLLMGMMIIFVHPLFALLFSEKFAEGWVLVPPLLFAVTYQNFAMFTGVAYLAGKKTVNELLTTMLTGFINIILGFAFIHWFGIIGAALASFISFFVLFILRLRDTKKFVVVQIKKSVFIGSQIVLFFLTMNVLFVSNLLLQAGFSAILFGMMIWINRSLIIKLYNRFLLHSSI